MDRKLIAEDLAQVAKMVIAVDDVNPLDGLRKAKAIHIVNNVIRKVNTRGFFSDSHWKPIHKIFSQFSKNDLPYSIEKTRYDKDDNGEPATKRWWVEIPFINERGREQVIHVHIIASGAGTVAEPLSTYDVVAYAT